jgi:oxygen-independent coproporphyrinogen-3 oxidase
MAFPDYILATDRTSLDYILLEGSELENEARFVTRINLDGKSMEEERCFPFEPRYRDKDNQFKKWARVLVYDLLCRFKGRNINPYGILTGVRPVKPVHRFLDQGLYGDMLERMMQSEYCLTEDKSRLLCKIVTNNHPYLLSREEARRLISVYIGIPYCPSRCYYCSFPGAVLSSYDNEIPPFLTALYQEIEALGLFLREKGLQVHCLYVGGGTPSILSHNDLGNLFNKLHQYFFLPVPAK